MMSEGSGEYVLPFAGSDGLVRISPRIRERYLTLDVETAIVQATGYTLDVRIWSDRANVLIQLPLDGYRAERPYERSIHQWGVNVNRWTAPGKSGGSEAHGWHNDAALVIGMGGDSAKPMIRATVKTFEGDEPDV